MDRVTFVLLLVASMLLCTLLGVVARDRFVAVVASDGFADRFVEVPKRIWTYWDTPELPDVVARCIQTWRKHNPDHDIVIIHPSNVADYLDEKVYEKRHADSSARIADFVRLALLARYGGIWMDSTTICNEPLQWVQDAARGAAEYVGFFMPNFTTKPEFPVVESWFMACVPNSSFMRAWHREFNTRLNGFDTVQAYLDDVTQKQGVDLQNISYPAYLTIHVACQKVLQQDADRVHPFALSVRPCNAEGGPFWYLNQDWDSTAALKRLCQDPAEYQTPVVKLRGSERQALEKDPTLLCAIPA